MNFSEEHKIIWWAPERTATEATGRIFKELGFHFDRTDEMIVNRESDLHLSHEEHYGDDYNGYNIICNIRNPYDRIFSIFMNFDVLGSLPATKEVKPKLIPYFKKWIKTYFEKNKLIVKINDYGKSNITSESLKKFTFRNRIPDQFIRMENLIDDLSELDFIKESIEWKMGQSQSFLKNNQFIKSPYYNFKEFYDFESAKLIYEYYFFHFHLVGYDPFSFTDETLDEKTKLHFIHDTF